MARAKKLPSGSWRCLAYSHSVPVTDDKGMMVIDSKTGKQKMKRVYESFTSDDPSNKGKREAELRAAEFQMDKSKTSKKKGFDYRNMTLAEAIDAYIKNHISLCSPTTIQDYRCIQKFAFRDLMDMKLKDLDEVILTEAVNAEARRKKHRCKKSIPISAKRLKNEWGLITAVLNTYCKGLEYAITLPKVPERVPDLLPAKTVLEMIHDTDIELPVLLACWLSYSMSEVRGLTKSKSLKGNYLLIAETVVNVNNQPYRKDIGKNPHRNRMHRIPSYIMQLIDKIDGDIIVPMSGSALYHKWIRLQESHGVKQHMTFHDLRHLSASVMALLRVPDKYAQERGGWKSDKVMKNVYMQTITEEREKVDDMVDNYFQDILSLKDEPPQKATAKEIVETLNASYPDVWQDILAEYMQHEMQHKIKNPLQTQGI